MGFQKYALAACHMPRRRVRRNHDGELRLRRNGGAEELSVMQLLYIVHAESSETVARVLQFK